MPHKGQSETAVVNREEALQLRMGGMSYYNIGKALGVAKSTAYGYVQQALEEIQEECDEKAQEVRMIELARIERMILGIWQNAINGDLYAIDRISKLMERKAKILGIDAPTRVDQEVKGTSSVSININFIESGDKEPDIDDKYWVTG